MKDVITDNYKLLHGDCLERMKDIPDGSVDLINSLYDEYTDKAEKESNEKMWYHHVGVVFACETILSKVQDLEYDDIGC